MKEVVTCPKCGSENIDEWFLLGKIHTRDCRDCNTSIVEKGGDKPGWYNGKTVKNLEKDVCQS